MMIGGAQVRFGQIAKSFVLRNVFSIILLAIAFASTVAAGAFLSARFVARSIERVTRLALAIEPRAPQTSISLDEVPVELKPLVSALNRAFHEIDAYIQRQRRFLGNAAHQLRTPLTLLRGKIEDVTEPALKAELVRDVRRLTSLVSAMLDLARLQNHAIEKRAIDLGALTRDVLADFSPSALDAGIELSLEHVPQGSVVVHGVEAAVRSALANLVGNALIHAHGAGRIVANLSRGSVSISDDGAGILPSSQFKLIEPFQTGGTATEGPRARPVDHPGDHDSPRRYADHYIDPRTRDDGLPPLSGGFAGKRSSRSRGRSTSRCTTISSLGKDGHASLKGPEVDLMLWLAKIYANAGS